MEVAFLVSSTSDGSWPNLQQSQFHDKKRELVFSYVCTSPSYSYTFSSILLLSSSGKKSTRAEGPVYGLGNIVHVTRGRSGPREPVMMASDGRTVHCLRWRVWRRMPRPAKLLASPSLETKVRYSWSLILQTGGRQTASGSYDRTLRI